MLLKAPLPVLECGPLHARKTQAEPAQALVDGLLYRALCLLVLREAAAQCPEAPRSEPLHALRMPS